MKLSRLGLGAALLLCGTTPAVAGATVPTHEAPSLKSVLVYDRADGTVLVIANVAHTTHSTAASQNDSGRITVSLSRRGHVVTGTDTTRLRGVLSRGMPVQFRTLLSPRKAAELGLRASGAPRHVRVGLKLEHRTAGHTLSEASTTESVLVRRVERGTPTVARAAAAGDGLVRVTTSTGFPPDPLRFGLSWGAGQPPTTAIDWTWTSPYQPYFSMMIYDKSGECMLQPVYDSNNQPSSFIHTDGTFNMTAGFNRCGTQGSTVTGRLSPAMNADGTVAPTTKESLNMMYNFGTYGPGTPGSAIVPVLPE